MFWACQDIRCRLLAAAIAREFPIRAQTFPGTKRRKILLSSGAGYHPTAEGRKKRMSIHGKEISPDIGQINVKIVEAGTKPVEELLGKAPKEEKE